MLVEVKTWDLEWGGEDLVRLAYTPEAEQRLSRARAKVVERRTKGKRIDYLIVDDPYSEEEPP